MSSYYRYLIFDQTHRLWTVYSVTKTLAFLYQFNNGLSPLFVIVSSTYAQRLKKSSCDMTLVSFPVIAR